MCGSQWAQQGPGLCENLMPQDWMGWTLGPGKGATVSSRRYKPRCSYSPTVHLLLHPCSSCPHRQPHGCRGGALGRCLDRWICPLTVYTVMLEVKLGWRTWVTVRKGSSPLHLQLLTLASRRHATSRFSSSARPFRRATLPGSQPTTGGNLCKL